MQAMHGRKHMIGGRALKIEGAQHERAIETTLHTLDLNTLRGYHTRR